MLPLLISLICLQRDETISFFILDNKFLVTSVKCLSSILIQIVLVLAQGSALRPDTPLLQPADTRMLPYKYLYICVHVSRVRR